jgi:hypothetical protein
MRAAVASATLSANTHLYFRVLPHPSAISRAKSANGPASLGAFFRDADFSVQDIPDKASARMVGVNKEEANYGQRQRQNDYRPS